MTMLAKIPGTGVNAARLAHRPSLRCRRPVPSSWPPHAPPELHARYARYGFTPVNGSKMYYPTLRPGR